MIICYICDGYGTLSDGRKCPNCGGSGNDVETERIWKEVIQEQKEKERETD